MQTDSDRGRWTVGLAQMRVLPGRSAQNLATMERFIARAREQGIHFLVFPEMCVGGYLLGDRWTNRAFCEDLAGYNETLRAMSKGMVLVWGNISIDAQRLNKDGRERKYNAAFACADLEWLPREKNTLPPGQAIKTLLPNYRVFDDERYFLSAVDLSMEEGRQLEEYQAPFFIPRRVTSPTGDIPAGLKFGVQICEDLWFRDYRRDGRGINVTGLQVKAGAEFIVNISASPWTWGKNEARHRRVAEAMSDAGKGVPFAYVNCVGVQNNGKNFVTFDGASTVYGPDAGILSQASTPYEEELLTAEIRRGQKSTSWVTHPQLPQSGVALPDEIPLAKTEAQYRAAIEALRSLEEQLGADFPVVVGLSGGIDSAVVACLVTLALGSHRLHAFNLPSRYNSEDTRKVAHDLAHSLGCRFYEIGIEELVAVNTRLLERFNPSQLNLENIQAKVRGSSILSNVAGILGGVMTNNGNKVEIALGYATLYGDVNGAVAPLGDLLKTEVFAMAVYLNRRIFGREVIPASLLPDRNFSFSIAPSAELKEAQRDPMKWGYHDALLSAICTYRHWGPDEVLTCYANGDLFQQLAVPQSLVELYGLDNAATFIADLEWFFRSFHKGVFKRIQAPPIVVMSKSSFGYDFRESQLPWELSERYMTIKRNLLGGMA